VARPRDHKPLASHNHLSQWSAGTLVMQHYKPLACHATITMVFEVEVEEMNGAVEGGEINGDAFTWSDVSLSYFMIGRCPPTYLAFFKSNQVCSITAKTIEKIVFN
jgi:hypothetical protein